MTGMIAELLAWPTLGVALLVFGFAPGVALRLIVLFYRRGNPRRQELLGELYAVPRIERPFWVAEQLEVALFEGLRDRFRAWRNKTVTRTAEQLGEQVYEQFKERLYKRYGTEQQRGAFGDDLKASEDYFASLLADDVSRSWRGRGWRGSQPEVPPRDDHDASAGV